MIEEAKESMETTKENVLEYIKGMQHVTCVELFNMFGKGSYEIWMPEFNIMYAYGMSDKLSEILNDLINSVEVVLIQTTMLTYIIDGNVPKMEIAKKLIKYRTCRWLPVTFSTYSHAIPELNRDKDYKGYVEGLKKRYAASHKKGEKV